MFLPEIKERLPNSVIIWSHIFKRKHRFNAVASLEGEKCWGRINSSIATFILKKLGWWAIGFPDTFIPANQRHLYRSDGFFDWNEKIMYLFVQSRVYWKIYMYYLSSGKSVWELAVIVILYISILSCAHLPQIYVTKI